VRVPDPSPSFVNRPVVLVGYDPRWPADFEREADRIRGALGERAARIEHVGSTSIPGLAAKPQVDIQVSVSSFEPEGTLIGPLEAIGYANLVDPSTPEHRILYRRRGDDRYGVNIHVCEVGSDWEWRHLAFRDHLRMNPEVAAAYAEDKRRIRAQHPNDVEAYASEKGRFIRPIEWGLRGPEPRGPIRVVDPDPSWPDTFAYEANRITSILAYGGVGARVEHIGSTAVPGLAAKPIVDILVSVPALEPTSAYATSLADVGFEYRPDADPEHRFFRFRRPNVRIANLHVCEAGSPWERRDLAFRDELRADARSAASYADLKRSLAARYPFDLAAYSAGKTDFVTRVLSSAGVAPATHAAGEGGDG
jgi:GrpB-like predicted nucleotidyltransferase (UPF0157 family)